MILENSKHLNADNFLPIAWGFLRPMGVACQHLADSEIQLYYYKGKHDSKFRHKHDIDLRTPDVLCELNWPSKKKYPSYLEVNISFHADFEAYPEEEAQHMIEPIP